MSATGALTTKMYASPVRPTTRTQAGYEALGSRTIDPLRNAGNLDTAGTWLIASAASAGAESVEVDQGATNFTIAANSADGGKFTIAGDPTVYTIVSHDEKTPSDTDAVTLNIAPPLAADAADNAAVTEQAADGSLILSEADYDALFTGSEVTVSAALAPLAVNTTYYVVKLQYANKIQFAASSEQARSGDIEAITGTLGAQTLSGSNWHLVGELTSIGEFGRSYESVTANNLASGATRKAKGSYNNGSVSFEALYDSRDPGAQVMEQGLVDTSNYAFWVDIPPDGDGNDGENIYFQALIMSFMPRVGGPNDMVMSTGSLEIDHNDPVRVAA